MRLLLFFTLLNFSLLAQDTISVMSYNILNFPNTSSTKVDSIKGVVQYMQPDIFMVTELNSLYGSNLILNNALNVNGINYYAAAQFIDGPDSDNNLYYNTNKFGLKSQYQIPTGLRDISEYILYFKSPDLGTNTDTIFFYCYMVHLKASSGSSNEQQRQQEVQALVNHINTHPEAENILVAGDFNFYASSEPGYYTLTTGAFKNIYDPISKPGNWHNNSSFATIHTQSTRTTNMSDGGSTGGFDDRFDFIFVSGDLMSGTNRAIVIPSSYQAVGQDGIRFNQSLLSPLNQAVPQSIANKMYYISDHLPVYSEFALGGTVGINNFSTSQNFELLNYNNYLFIKNKTRLLHQNFNVSIYNNIGQLLINNTFTGNQTTIATDTLKTGIYFLTISDQEGNIIQHLKFFKL